MIGYIRPKLKLKCIQVSDEEYAYKIDLSDDLPKEYRELSEHIFATEEDAYIAIDDIRWRLAMEEDRKELDRLRDELIATQAVIGARIDRLIKQLGDIADYEELPNSIGGMSLDSFYGMQEYDKELRLRIEELDAREEQIRKILTEKWATAPDRDTADSSWTMLAADRSIARLSAAETRRLLRLYNLAVFGSEACRREAREEIFELLRLGGMLEKMTDEERRRKVQMMNEANDPSNVRWNKYTFSSYISEYLASEGLTQQELAGRIGVNRSMITRYLNGDNLPDKPNSRKLAAAMGLSGKDISVFIHSAGHSFPNENDAKDMALIEAASTVGNTWIDLLAALGVGEEEEKDDDEIEVIADKKAKRKRGRYDMRSER